MVTPILTFFNNKGGVGKTSLVYHLTWMFSQLDKSVLAVDLDPQANLTAAFLEEEKIEKIWNKPEKNLTIYQCVKPITEMGDIKDIHLHKISDKLYFIAGDVSLSSFEATLSEEWPRSMDNDNLYRPMRILSSFWQIIQKAIKEIQAEIVILDIGPNLGAINRSALLATDYIIIPLGADLFSLQGLKNLGPTLSRWKETWYDRVKNWKKYGESQQKDFLLPEGKMQSIGYLCQQFSTYSQRPTRAYEIWANRIPNGYRELSNEPKMNNPSITKDEYCLATIKHYRGLISIAQEKRKAIFNLSTADGVFGAHSNAVQSAKRDFKELALKIAELIGISTARTQPPLGF